MEQPGLRQEAEATVSVLNKKRHHNSNKLFRSSEKKEEKRERRKGRGIERKRCVRFGITFAIDF